MQHHVLLDDLTFKQFGNGVPRDNYCSYCGFGSLDGGTIPLVRM
jgi:hypothetical protein